MKAALIGLGALALLGCDSPTTQDKTPRHHNEDEKDEVCASYVRADDAEWGYDDHEGYGCTDKSIAYIYDKAKDYCPSCGDTIAVYPEPPEGQTESYSHWRGVEYSDAYIGRAREVGEFFANGNGDAEGEKASLYFTERYLSQLRSKGEFIVEKPNWMRDDLIEVDWVEDLATLGGNKVTALTKQLAAERIQLEKLDTITDIYIRDVDERRPRYDALVVAYKAFREGEEDTLAGLTQLSQAASLATLEQLPAINKQLADAAADESGDPIAILVEAKRLKRELFFVQKAYDSAIAPFVDFMAAKNFRGMGVTQPAMEALGRIVSYLEARRERMTTVFTRLSRTLSSRTRTLVAQQAGAQTASALGKASRTQTTTKFLKQTQTWIADLWQQPAKSLKLGLPYQSARLDRARAFLQLEPLCGSLTSTPWMAEGCALLKVNFSKTKQLVQTTTPFAIKLAVTKLRTAGLDEAVLAPISEALAAGQLDLAALRHDVALALSDKEH